MKKWLSAGAALLILQILLAVILQATERHYGAFTPQANWLKFSPTEVDSLTVTGEDGKQVTIAKVNGVWQLPELFHAQADQARMEELLKKLAGLKQGLAVATTKGAAKHFKVSEGDFERHVVLKKGEAVAADFFLGTSPGFKMIHARVNGRPEIVSVELNAYEMEPVPERWLDRRVAQVERDKITGLAMGDIELTRQNKVWGLAGLADNEELNPAGVDQLLTKVSGLLVDGVLDPAEGQELFKEGPALTISLTLADNSKRLYTLVKPEKQNYYVLKSSANDLFFKVGSQMVDGLRNVSRASLVKPKTAEPTQAEGPASAK